jgi:hypothetical protein
MESEKIEWQEKFRLKEELNHGDFEAIELALFDMPNAARIFKNVDLSVVRGAWLKAAIQAGWIVSPECKAIINKKTNQAAFIYDGVEVDSLHPGKVAWLGKKVVERHDAVMSDDPKNW